jgi:uncharacterized protein YegJ (DUF2314 family)
MPDFKRILRDLFGGKRATGDGAPSPTPRVESWELEDVETVHARSHETFQIASREERLNLKPGRGVRLHFRFPEPLGDGCRAERMWVTITHADGNGGFRGMLENDPVYIRGLRPGDEVLFHARNVAQVLVPRGDPAWIDEHLLAIVSRRVLERRHVGYLMRSTPDNPRDSGWQVFTGDEEPEYLADAATIEIVSLGRLMGMDGALRAVLGAPQGSAFERSGDGFVPVPNE